MLCEMDGENDGVSTLLVEEVERNSSKEILMLSKLLTTCEELWRNVRVILSKFKNSHNFKKLLKGECEKIGIEYRQPILYARTRWIGCYFELRRFNYLAKAISSLSENSLRQALQLPDGFFTSCRQLLGVLELFYVPINDLQSSSKPTASYQIIVTRILHQCIEKEKNISTLVIVRKFCSALLHSITRRFSVFFDSEPLENNQELRPYLAAQLLDVSTRSHWEQETALHLILAEYSEEVHSKFPKQSENTVEIMELPLKRRKTSSTSSAQDVSRINDIRTMIFGSTSSACSKNESYDRIGKLQEEARVYIHFVLAMEENIGALDFWKAHGAKFPLLQHVASIVLGQPCGSYDTERKCSDVGNNYYY